MTTGGVTGRGVGLVVLAGLAWLVVDNGLGVPSGAVGLLHMMNLVFHEAGHVIFGVFGQFVGVLGGSLMQVLVPTACTAVFVGRGEPASAAVTLFWAGESVTDVAIYVADGKAMRLPLLADGLIHDWNYLLGTLGWLPAAPALGRLTFGVGVIIMLAAMAVLALDLARAWRARVGDISRG